MHKTVLALVVIAILASIIGGCTPPEKQATFTADEVVRNPLYSASEQGNGALVLYTINSDVDGYCIPHPKPGVTADSIMREDGDIFMHTKSMLPDFDANSAYQRCRVVISGTAEIWLVVSYEFITGRAATQ